MVEVLTSSGVDAVHVDGYDTSPGSHGLEVVRSLRGQPDRIQVSLRFQALVHLRIGERRAAIARLLIGRQASWREGALPLAMEQYEPAEGQKGRLGRLGD